MARVNIKLHYTMNKAKFPMQKHYYGLRAQDPKLMVLIGFVNMITNGTHTKKCTR